MQPVLADIDVNNVEQMIATPLTLNQLAERVGHEMRHIDDPIGFTRSVLARLAQCSRASVRFIDGVPIWTRITPPERA